MFWKNKWKKELDAIVPELSKETLSAPTDTVTDGGALLRAYKRKTALSFSAIGAAIILLFAFLIGTYALKLKGPMPDGIFAVEINPAAVFIIDGESNKIKAVKAINSDADVILSDEDNYKDMVGKSAEEAVNAFTLCAVKCGYIDLTVGDPIAAVRVSGLSANKLEGVREAVETFLADKGILSVVYVKELDGQGFSSLIGFDGADEKTLIKTVADAPKLKTDRSAEEKDVDGLKRAVNAVIEDITDEGIKAGLQFIVNSLDAENLSDYLDEINELMQDLFAARFNEYEKVYNDYVLTGKKVGKEEIEKIRSEIDDFDDYFANKKTKK